ncbi:hypothetical protein [Massilibacteroides sp.]|uniref:hypothetical protein n=1 Tax=Massilibacteroides sp. TaxID=2034766 RepID=UPI0026391835|nr:hypothetical protein [Massilibacteroides sp.]MDD4516498.1 hypothetical protein [Massilibacteroides sp.]
MKKIFLSLFLITSFFLFPRETGATDEKDIRTCEGSVWICFSEIDDLLNDMEKNCDAVDIEVNLVDC